MSSSTIPVFVIGSGRSGTRMISNLLQGISTIEIQHEYLPNHIQPISALYSMGLIDKEGAKRELKQLYGPAIYYSRAKYWIDCSHKASWLIDPLMELFPQVKFIHVVRDGRKVVSSFFHKLGDEIYEDESIEILQKWLADRANLPKPPPEKRYWWNVPQAGQPFSREFQKFSQFQRICYHWRESNRVILEAKARMQKDQYYLVKLEDLTKNKQELASFLGFVEVPYDEYLFELAQKPDHVIFPMNFKLTQTQKEQFDAIASDMMAQLGYSGTEEYTVDY